MDPRSHSSRFDTAVLTEAGGRENNEDSCDWRDMGDNACWVVADGLGGHKGGEIAASAATHAVLDSFARNPELSPSALQQHLSAAQAAVQQWQQQDPALAGMRTTLVTLITNSQKVLWGHVGDSRLYWFRDQRLLAQTEDHSVPQALVKAGDLPADKIRGHSDRNRLLRSIGEPGALRSTVLDRPKAVASGDAFLLCTDGFWEHVMETEMLADLAAAACPAEWLTRLKSRLLTRASGAYDNYSAVSIFFAPVTVPAEARSDTGTEAVPVPASEDQLARRF